MKLESDLLFGWGSSHRLSRIDGPSRNALAALCEPLQQLIDDLPEQIALVDEDCTIFAANGAWKRAAEEHGYADVLPGNNYRDFCARKAAKGYEPAREALAALDDIRADRRTFWQLIYNGRENWRGRDYQISFHRIWFGGHSFISITRFDLTEILELRRARRSHGIVDRRPGDRTPADGARAPRFCGAALGGHRPGARSPQATLTGA